MKRKTEQRAIGTFDLVPFKSKSCKNGMTSPTRRLFLVDIENYCGKSVLANEDVRNAKLAIARDFGLNEADLVVVGTSHAHNCLISGTEWRGSRQVLMHGRDGADFALIEASREYRISTFAAVVLVSGDGVFAETVRKARAFGRPVVVAARKTSMSRKLAFAASAIRYVGTDERIAA